MLNTLWTLTKYAGVGVVNTIIGVGVMVILGVLGANYVIYTFFGYVVGLLVSYTLNSRVTFKKEGWSNKRVVYFFAVNSTLIILVELAQYLLIDRLGAAELPIVGCGMLTYTGIGFTLNRVFVFSIE